MIKAVETCEKCGKENEVNQTNVKQEMCMIQDKKAVRVTYYVCTCGYANVVQVDDAKSIEDFKKLSKLTIRRIRNRCKVEPGSREKKDRLEARLHTRRTRLLGEYKDTISRIKNADFLSESH